MEPFPPRWRRLDHPLVDNVPTDQPLVVETALGTIEWNAAESSGRYVDNVLEVSDGYLGVSWSLDPIGGAGFMWTDQQIVKSSDGAAWTPIPPPPDSFDLIAVHDDVLYAFIRRADPMFMLFPDPVYSTDDLGATWIEVPMAPDPRGDGCGLNAQAAACLTIADVVSGDGGIVVTTQEAPFVGPLWVLGDDGFDRIEAPFTGQLEVHVDAVDDGFFAYAGDAEGTAWFSTDGRTWTEASSQPAGLTVSAVIGSTIYGISDRPGSDNDRAVVSTDGGRTWAMSPERPLGSMEASDNGLVISASWTDSGQCAKVLWVSADDREWERALDLWPGGGCVQTSMTGNTIRVVAYNDAGTAPVTWIGAIT